jgi:hypothetical protein
MNTPPGWYPDPGNSACVRWWNGQIWTGDVRPSAPAQSLPSESTAAAIGNEIAQLRLELEGLRRDVVETREIVALQEVGVYRYAHPLENALAYKTRLEQIEEQVRQITKQGRAVVGTTQWAINGSQKEGAKMVSDFCKLLLRAYNDEVDNAVRTLKPFMLESAVRRLEKARATIQKLGTAMRIEITDDYHSLRVTELQLTADFLAKREEEREQERQQRARMKEEEAVRREFEREQERLEKERTHYETVIAALREKGDVAAAEKAEIKMMEVDNAIAGIENRSANVRAGYVYCISNIGAFGPSVVKIGLTRRLEPLDRVRELGDASVPFRFDVHALIFSENAVGLETMLHVRFADRRVNLVNGHREFFHVTPAEVRAALLDVHGSLITFEEVPEALEWRQSEHARQGR